MFIAKVRNKIAIFQPKYQYTEKKQDTAELFLIINFRVLKNKLILNSCKNRRFR